MGYVLGTRQKGIIIFHPDIKKDKKGVALVRYLLNGTIVYTVHVVTLS